MNFYRGESKNYHENREAFIPSIYREFKDKTTCIGYVARYINDMFDECSVIAAFENNEIEKDNSDEVYAKKYIKRLGLMQHYGMKSTLLDVTENEKIALYFACEKEFSEDGYIFLFDDKKMKGLETRTVQGRMNIIWRGDLNYEDYKRVLDKHYCFDYRKNFYTRADNLRYERQEGRFILHGYVKKGNSIEPVFPEYRKAHRIINAKEKIEHLLKLALEDKITFVYVYPDSEESISVVSSWFMNRKDVLKESDYPFLKKKVWKDLVSKLKESFEGYCFLNTSLKKYIEEKIKSETLSDEVARKLLKITLRR